MQKNNLDVFFIQIAITYQSSMGDEDYQSFFDRLKNTEATYGIVCSFIVKLFGKHIQNMFFTNL